MSTRHVLGEKSANAGAGKHMAIDVDSVTTTWDPVPVHTEPQHPTVPMFHGAHGHHHPHQPPLAAASWEPASAAPAEPFEVAGYIDEIIDHLLVRQTTLQRDANYLTTIQTEISERMRIILMDWLVDVHIKFKLHTETFFLAVDIVDRYLMNATATRANLQLVGVTAMLLAAKHEEIWPPEIKECIYISANTYTRDDILRMERAIANALNFRMCVPTQFPFATRVLDATDACFDGRNLAAFFLDASALEYQALQFPPSVVGCAAVLLANATIDANLRARDAMPPPAPDMLAWTEGEQTAVWGPRHAAACGGLRLTDDGHALVRCARVILASARGLLDHGTKYQALRRKYSNEKWGSVVLRYGMPASL